MIDEHSDREARALGRARAGDESAFQELVAPYRRELHLHCYRILGSLQDAEDTVQETLLAAWRGLAGFEERAFASRLAVSDRDEPLPEPAPRPQAPTAGGTDDGAAAQADAHGRADVA